VIVDEYEDGDETSSNSRWRSPIWAGDWALGAWLARCAYFERGGSKLDKRYALEIMSRQSVESQSVESKTSNLDGNLKIGNRRSAIEDQQWRSGR